MTDIEQAKKFYGNTLGLDAIQTNEGLQLRLAFGGEVFLYPKSDHSAATYTVLNFVVPNIEKTVVDLNAEGVNLEQYDMGDLKTDERGIVINPTGIGPYAIAWFKDPFGNIIGVMQEKKENGA